MAPPLPTKAAQYVRMSTEKQIFSTENQIAAIASYAVLHQFDIVRTYADEGRSGLRLKGRAALQEMLSDVLAGNPGYSAILVFDVSRWGRFQDCDESAHLEWLCRSAGVQVHYCAEMFDNDGSLPSTIAKSLRRAMAGEFSRDLSAKVWAAQCRLVSQGYKMGGKAGYGLQRLLVDREGNAKQVLRDGEHKSITTDRVILVPGDPEQVKVVRRIFRLAEKGLSNAAISKILNADGVPAAMVAKWSGPQVRQILNSERYLGNYVYNKRSAKLGAGYVHNPRDKWIRCENAFPPLISGKRFRRVQNKERSAKPNYSDDDLLMHLRRLELAKGYLTRQVIAAASPPSGKTYTNRFGSLANAYAKIGYNASARAMHQPVGEATICFASEIQQALSNRGHRIDVAPFSKALTIDGRVVITPRIYNMYTTAQRNYWQVRFAFTPDVDFVLAALMKEERRTRTYLLPIAKFARSGRIDIGEKQNRVEQFEVIDFDQLSAMLRWASR